MSEQVQGIENEEIIDIPEVIVEDKPETLRETIEKSRQTVAKSQEETKEKKTVKVKSHERTVNKEDKFSSTPVIKGEESAAVLPVKQEEIRDIPMPQRYGAAVKAKWGELPPDIRQELLKSEQDFHKELTKHDEERNFGRQMKDVVTPYIAQIRAEGAEPAQAVGNLLNMAHVLRVGSPQQKSDLLLRTAQTFGVDLRQALQVQPQMPPQVQQVMQEMHGLKQQLAQQEALKKQTEDNEIQGQIKAFSSDPKNTHFEAVKAHMASLLSSGLAKDLQDAYDQAVYANPHTRSTLLEAQKAESTEKRVAEQKARADAARKAGSSIKGSPGMAITKNGKINGLDLRSTIKAAFADQMEG